MKNKKIWIILSGIAISLIIVGTILIIVNNDKNTNIKDIKLEKVWNLSYGDEITPDMYEDEDLNFAEDDGNKSFVSIDKNNEGYVLVGTNGENSFVEQGIIEYYDLNGKIQWTKKYPNIDSNNWEVTSVFKDVLAVKDGYIVIGYETGDSPEFGDGYQNAIIIKYDLNGNLLWTKKYNTLISTANLDNNLSYKLIDIINFNEKYYIVGNLNEYLITQEGKSLSFHIDKKYGIIIELDSNGNEISFNEYNEGSEFFSAQIANNKIIINSLLDYKVIDNDEYYYASAEGLGLLTFDGSNFNQILKYAESDEAYGILQDYYKKFTYLNGVYYLVDPTTIGKILAIDKDGNEKFSMHADDGDALNNYWFQDITTDGENIYVYAYYYDMYESHEMTDSVILIFDKDGNYNMVDIDEQYYYQILFKDDSLLLPGSENSFAKYKINR